ncbi:hypothetical protein JW921_01155, partial [Candidatus Fermentibacterales bacterium]|nr:hypothetical protein [Candidatus Fermentibacterales bacterium]
MRSCLVLSAILLAGLTAASAGELVVDIPFDASLVSIENLGVYTGVTVPGLGLLNREGFPALPYMPVRVALPTGCRATSIELLDADYASLDGYFRILPSEAPVPFSVEQEVYPVEPNPVVYGSDVTFPFDIVRFNSSGALWGIPMARLTVYPVRWNPASGQIQVLESITVSVSYEYDPDVMTVHRRAESSEQSSMDLARKLVVNPEGVSPSGAEIVEARELAYGQYVIVCDAAYQSQAQEIADWKTAKGVPSNVYTDTWVGSQYSCYDLPQEIRAFLTDCRDEGADYVLLFGDDNVLACRDAYIHAGSYSDNAPCDLYFSDINDSSPGADQWDSNGNHIWGEDADNVEWTPDIWAGRGSVNSATDANVFVDKVLIYEGIADTDYFETAPREMRMGYSTGILWTSPYCPGSAGAEMISAYVPSGWEEEKCYESTGNNSSAITIAMINAGPHHVYHASHGSATSMYTSYGSNYTVSNIMAQTNISSGHLPAIWNSIACLIGRLDGYECCGDAWNNSPNGAGFGCFNARYGWGTPSSPGNGPSEILSRRFYYEHWNNDLYILGIAHGTSLDYYCPPSDDYLEWCIKEYNLFGDPELPMWTVEALDMDADHPGYIGGATTVTVTVTDPTDAPVNNARVCLQKGNWQTGDVYEIGYTNTSGVANIYVSPTSSGTITVTVTAREHLPYQGSITCGTGIEDEGEQVFTYSLS